MASLAFRTSRTVLGLSNTLTQSLMQSDNLSAGSVRMVSSHISSKSLWTVSRFSSTFTMLIGTT